MKTNLISLLLIIFRVCIWSEVAYNQPNTASTKNKNVNLKFLKSVVVTDNNKDGMINKGETIFLRVYLVNYGSGIAKSVKGTFLVNSPFISKLAPTCAVNFRDIKGGTAEYGHDSAYQYTIKFTVSNTTPSGTQIPIKINITDNSGGTWSSSFMITVESSRALIVCDKFEVVADNNGDSIVNVGETVFLKIYLANKGKSSAKGVKAEFTTNSTFVTQFAPIMPISYGELLAGKSNYGKCKDFEYTVRFTVSRTMPVNTQIPISINIVDESANTWNCTLLVTAEKTRAAMTFSTFSLISDNNGDGKVNKGETVYLKIFLTNKGTSTAKAVKARFSTTSNYVFEFAPSDYIYFGDISAKASESVYSSDFYTIKFTVSNKTPPNTIIPIEVNISDDIDNQWKCNFNVKVEATGALLTYGKSKVISDNNNDGEVNKGETAYLKIFLANKGTSAAKAVKATFSTKNAYVTQFTPTSQLSFGDIALESMQSVNYSDEYTLKFTVSNTIPENSKIPIDIDMIDECENRWNSTFDVPVEQTKAKIEYSSSMVVSDNNNNTTVNKGETVYLKIQLSNKGTSTAKAIKATFATTSIYVSNFTPTTPISYGDITAGRTEFGYDTGVLYTIGFKVSDKIPANTLIPISITITDESMNVWTSSFNVSVK